MKVALIGYGVENQSVYGYFVSKGVYPVICTRNPATEVPEGSSSVLGPEYLDNLDQYDLIVRSVGINPSVILDKNPGVKAKITTAINLFFEECKTPIIGVTGTKGKGTTSSLIHKFLEAAGKKSLLAGNIGLPMLDILDKTAECDYVVLELSSFQLYDCHYSPHIAVCLMVVPEHLDWHTDLHDYFEAKANLFRNQTLDDFVVYNALNPNSEVIAAKSPSTDGATYAVPPVGQESNNRATVYVSGDSIFYKDTLIMKTNGVKLLGRHNLENVCAAIAATWDVIGGNIEAIKSVVSTFSGLEFRLQKIRELDGVQYINDSFSTTPETAIAALVAFEQPKIAILGGSDKGVPFDELADAVVANKVKHVLAIGERGPIIANLLQKRDYTNITVDGLDDMPAIVAKAREIAESGDVVLLSTGCASFGMFKNYKDRGNQFNNAVNAL